MNIPLILNVFLGFLIYSVLVIFMIAMLIFAINILIKEASVFLKKIGWITK